jgi:hypothetical protein
MPKAFYEPGKLSNGKPISYGFGVFFDTYKGEKIIEHGGSDSAFRAHIMTIPARGFAVIILANTDNLPIGDFVRKIADIVLGLPSEKSDPQMENTIPPIPNGEKYAGFYLIDNGTFLNIIKKSAGLFILSNGSEVPLRLIEPDILGLTGTGIKIKFLREGNNDSYTAITLLAGPNSDTGHRTQEMEIPPALLDQIAGSYFSPEVEKFFDIYTEKGKAGSRLSNGMKIPFVYVGNNTFVSPLTEMKIVFLNDGGSTIRRALISSFRLRNLELIKGLRPGN